MSLPVRLLVPGLFLAAFWWLLTGGEPASWGIGLPVVLSATWARHRLKRGEGASYSLRGLIRFLPFFFWQSLWGGLDVARRTLSPRLPVDPGFFLYRTRLSQPQARVFFANCISLLPGTLSADLQDDRINVHLLDAATDPTAELVRLEHAVQGLFPTHRSGRKTT